jgi:hypothetical protein
MSTNKEYRNYEGFEDALYKLSDIIDLIDDCKEDVRYVENISETLEKLNQSKEIIDEVMKLISYKK